MTIPSHLFGIPVVVDNPSENFAGFYVRLPSLVFVVATESSWPMPKGSWDITVRTNTDRVAAATVRYRQVEGVPDEVVVRSDIEEAVRAAIKDQKKQLEELERSLVSECPWGAPKEIVLLGITATPTGPAKLEGEKGPWKILIIPKREYEDTYNPLKKRWSHVEVTLRNTKTFDVISATGNPEGALEQELLTQLQDLVKHAEEASKFVQALSGKVPGKTKRKSAQ
jgi:hypothetical protein